MTNKWEKPQCLIQTTSDGGIEINHQTLSQMCEVKEKVVVVAIAGIYRTGKSYLMNLLAGEQGFDLGSTIMSQTKGIWVWVRPHPLLTDTCLVLLDTEGLADPDKGSTQHDTMIFALTVLLSCSLTYNSQNTIDNDAITKLHFITEIAKHVKVKVGSEAEDGTEFARVFPDFIWAVRDFHLSLEDNGRQITSDEYLEKVLQLKKGITPDIMMNYNLPRQCIRNYFPSRKCFTFPSPVEARDDLKNLEKIPISQLDRGFVQMSEQYAEYIFKTTAPKSIGGRQINGSMLGNLAKYYVSAIQAGAIPCIETAVESTSKIENSKAVQESVAHYKSRMNELVKLPTENVFILSGIHSQCEKEAISLFLKLCIFDNDNQYQEQMAAELKKAYEAVCDGNIVESKRVCATLLNTLYQPIGNKLADGMYSKPGGYTEYTKDMEQLEFKYDATKGKGTQSKQTIAEFMMAKESESKSVLMADKRLDEKQKRVEEEKQKAEAAHRQQHAAEEEARRAQQDLQDQQRSYDENMNQLTEKVELDKQKLLEENQKMLSSKLSEQEKLLKEGFRDDANMLQEEIQSLKEQQNGEDSDFGGGLFSLIGKGIDGALGVMKHGLFK